jgi:deoxyribodipyrimidine photolyase-related protein
MNLHRLLPRAVVRDVERLEIPLASKEGFIRQVLGWREFVKHVHDATEGFRKGTSVAQGVGDGGHARWRSRAQEGVSGQPKERPAPGTPPGQHGWLTSATPAALGKDTPLPDAYWGQPSGMNCLDHVVKSVWAEGYSHHITRLMVLSNLATLLDVSPRELTDWFWIAYADAWDWVVEPNVLAMGTYAVGPLMTTKPYVSGAAYIDKMSDYCGSCALKPGITCPVTPMYWAFLDRHKAALDKTGRMMMPLRSLAKRSAAQRAADARVFVAVRDVLVKGQRVTPGLVERAVKEGSRA